MNSSHRVHLTRLTLTDFRNYTRVQLDCNARHIVLSGETGAGKTNLLEAVSFLSPGRGLRRAPYDAVGRTGSAGAWSVHAELEGAHGPVSIGSGLAATNPDGELQRRVRINGAPAKTSEELLEHSRIVWLTPAMDALFSGPASDRRKFLDRMVLAIDPTHGRRVADFDKSMRSRNRLLNERSGETGWLDAVEARMAETGVAITLARRELCALLSGVIEREGSGSPFPVPLLALHGGLDVHDAGVPAGEFETGYAEALRIARHGDAAAGRTLEGPHRNDLIVTHKLKAMPAQMSSTGEQKGLLIALFFAHARLVTDLSGSSPILLLDEIAAHLDSERRAALFDRIEALGGQAWMTGADRSLFETLGARAGFYRVGNGQVTAED